MVWLGVPATIKYEGQGFRSGLKGIFYVVEKPDGKTAGPFPMEEGKLFAQGRYGGTWTAAQDDPEGRYFFYITSPQEAGRQATVAIDMVSRPVPEIEVLADQQIETTLITESAPSIEVAMDLFQAEVISMEVGSNFVVETTTDQEIDVDVGGTPAIVTAQVDEFTVEVSQ